MELLLSWLGDHVDLGDGIAVERDDTGRCALARLDEGSRKKAFQLGEKLTAAGLAVEAIREIAPAEGGPDFVMDVEVTSNRPDAMCHVGLARELAVALGVPLRKPAVSLYGSLSSDGVSGAVVLEDPEGCPRYVARVIRGVKVGPSPEWLRRRLEAIGLRSINNVVDATNYVLWELGQPLHAFDLGKVPGGEIVVRRARAGERLVTLDGVERALAPEILVIADRERAIGLAGVMGGAATEVSAATTDVLLESAHFERRRIRIGSKRLGLHTDASHRFERGADFAVCDEASRRCAALLVELAGGSVDDDAIDAVVRPPETIRWRLEARALARFVGVEIDGEEAERILAGLGFAPQPAGAEAWEGVVPSWRDADFEPRRDRAERVAYAQDVYEEVLRHVGFDRVPATLPALGGVDEGASPEHERAARVRDLLAGLGYAETIHFAFQSRQRDDRFPGVVGVGEPLVLANPLSEQYAVLRRSLVANLESAADFNARRGAAGVRLFEVGHLFPGGDEPEQEAVAWVAGGAEGTPWDRPSEVDLFAVKGVGEAVLDLLGGADAAVEPAELTGVVPGTGAVWRLADGTVAGWFGRLGEAETPFHLYGGELILDRLPATVPRRAVVPPPRLPGIAADLTLTHPLAVTWDELAAAIRGGMRPPLVGFALKERYRGAGVPAGAVATTITLEYHGGERSLTQEEVNERQGELAAELERRFAVVREGEER
jgi:phenylalanyl-tRNA synthetase beta chain